MYFDKSLGVFANIQEIFTKHLIGLEIKLEIKN